MRVREAVPGDATAIHRVAARSHRAAYEPIVDDETLIEGVTRDDFAVELRRLLRRVADREDVVYLVCERRTGPGPDATGVAGFGLFSCDDAMTADYVSVGSGVALVQSLYVDPDCWGEGVGSRLLAAGVSRLPDSVERLKLGVHSDNERARAFYVARGFEKVTETVYELDDATYPADIYACALSSLDLPEQPSLLVTDGHRDGARRYSPGS